MKKNKLTRLLNNKKFLLILSLIISIAVWVTVSLSDTNDTYSTVSSIPIQINLSEDAVDNGLKIFTGNDQKASVTVSGRKETINNLNASEITVKCDMQIITAAGETVVKVSRPECERIGISVSDYYPKNITFNYDKTETKNLDVRVVYDNKLLEDGFEYVSVTPSLSSIPVTGMKSLIDTCDYIRIDLSDSIEEGTLDSNKNAAFLGKFISYAGETGENIDLVESDHVEITIPEGKPGDEIMFQFRASLNYKSDLLDPDESTGWIIYSFRYR